MKTGTGKASSVLLRIFAVAFGTFACWAAALTVVQCLQNKLYLPLALAPLAIALLSILWKTGRQLYRQIPDALLTELFAILCVLSLFGMLYVSHRLRQKFGVEVWDYSRLEIDAFTKAGGGEIKRSYYLRYPNNQLLLLILTALSKFVLWMDPKATREAFQQCAIALNCSAILTSVILTYCVLKKTRGAHFAFLAGISLLFYLPLWLYSPIYYTDTMGLPLIVLPVLLYTYLADGKTVRNIVLFCLMGIATAVGMKIKVSLVLVFAAIGVAVMLFERLKRKWLFVLIGTAALVLSSFLIQTGIDKTMHFTKDAYDEYRFPYSHWVMMSLGESGGYEADLVKYTASFETIAEREAGIAKKTKELLNERGFAGTVKHLFVTKMQHAWADGTLNATYYIGRAPAENGFFQAHFWERGAAFGPTKIYLTARHLTLLIFVTLSAVGLFFRPQGGALTVMKLSVFALMLFLMFWESSARYLIHIAPFLLVCAADGMSVLGRFLPERKKSVKSPENLAKND